MREMLSPTSSIVGRRASATPWRSSRTARFSGATRGAAIGHVCPEAAAGGVIGVVEEGDTIEIDIENGTIDLKVPRRRSSKPALQPSCPRKSPSKGT